ncbi:hypothetical protein DITRI_Ditri03aG0118200 [Diplodiscus trichospermus]
MIEERNDHKSLCEKSMKMVMNIIKLSSFSIAKMILGETGHPTEPKNLTTETHSDMVTDEVVLPQPPFSGSQRSEKLQISSKPRLFMMQQPGGANEPLMAHEERSDSDGMFAAYIRKVHEKNRSNLHEALKLSPFILPPPPMPPNRKK